jgi:hypothetical protein
MRFVRSIMGGLMGSKAQAPGPKEVNVNNNYKKRKYGVRDDINKTSKDECSF